ncbi:MAG: hypothetical protein GEU87_15240 [Alphaproteobacteria bacterium]|nr:hypothetical protein [Alphaproteobacteria bacterium]
MFLRYIFAPYLFLGLIFPTSLGSAETHDDSNCGQRTTVLDYLSTKYSEKPIAMGIAANGGLIEVLTSIEGSTFTIIVTMPEGETCMVAAGEGWEDLPTLARRPQI